MSVNLNIDSFYVTVEEEERRIKALMIHGKAWLISAKVSTSWLPEWTPIFGERGVPSAARMAVIRNTIGLAIARIQRDNPLQPGHFFGSVLEAKVAAEPKLVYNEQTKATTVSIEVKRQDEKFSTGGGVLLNLENKPTVHARTAVFLGCFAEETKDEITAVPVHPGLVALYEKEGVKLSQVPSAIQLVSAVKEALNVECTPATGTAMPHVIKNYVEEMAPEMQEKFSNMVGQRALQRISVESNGVMKKHQDSTWAVIPGKKVPATAVWVAPLKPKSGLGRAKVSANLEYNHPIAAEQDWLAKTTMYLGGTNIEAVAAGYGLSPSMANVEARVIRFASVVLDQIRQGKKVVVNAGAQMIQIAYYTCREYLMRKQQADIGAYLQEHFYFSPVNLKSIVIQGFKQNLRIRDWRGDNTGVVLVAWRPTVFSMKSTLKDTVFENDAICEDTLEFPHRIVFRLVITLNKDALYYFDGLVPVLNAWESTVGKVLAVTYDGKGYGTEALGEVKPHMFMSVAWARAMLLLYYPLMPSTTRSLRIFAVVGSKTLVFNNDEFRAEEFLTFDAPESDPGPAISPFVDVDLGVTQSTLTAQTTVSQGSMTVVPAPPVQEFDALDLSALTGD